MFHSFIIDGAPHSCRDRINVDDQFHATMALELHDRGIVVEPDSRESLCMCEAHDVKCREETLDKFAVAVDSTLQRRSNAWVSQRAATHTIKANNAKRIPSQSKTQSENAE